MTRDVDVLSPKAQVIFAKLELYFPPDPWKNPRWLPEGIVKDNWVYDLRKNADRKRLETWENSMIGYSVKTQASMYRDKHQGSLDGFTDTTFPRSIRRHVEVLLIVSDLDFQIETGDIVGD